MSLLVPSSLASSSIARCARYVYRHGLYAKHIASNAYTRFRNVAPALFAQSPDLRKKITAFLRRELRVFPSVDVEFLVTYVVSIMGQLELKSEGAIRLIGEFLGGEDRAEHFAQSVSACATGRDADQDDAASCPRSCGRRTQTSGLSTRLSNTVVPISRRGRPRLHRRDPLPIGPAMPSDLARRPRGPTPVGRRGIVSPTRATFEGDPRTTGGLVVDEGSR